MDGGSARRVRGEIDMRTFAKGAGATIHVAPGGIVFNKGEPGDCMYIVQSGVIDMVIGDTVIETIGANEALGFMSMIDEMPRSSTARARGSSRRSRARTSASAWRSCSWRRIAPSSSPRR